jgi:hypothetical protein
MSSHMLAGQESWGEGGSGLHGLRWARPKLRLYIFPISHERFPDILKLATPKYIGKLTMKLSLNLSFVVGGKRLALLILIHLTI